MQHLVDVHAELASHTVELSACREGCSALLRDLVEAADNVRTLTAEVPPRERDPNALEACANRIKSLREELEALSRAVGSEAQALRQPAAELGVPVTIPRGFEDSFSDLFRGHYYSPAIHEGTDLQPSGVTLDGARFRDAS